MKVISPRPGPHRLHDLSLPFLFCRPVSFSIDCELKIFFTLPSLPVLQLINFGLWMCHSLIMSCYLMQLFYSICWQMHDSLLVDRLIVNVAQYHLSSSSVTAGRVGVNLVWGRRGTASFDHCISFIAAPKQTFCFCLGYAEEIDKPNIRNTSLVVNDSLSNTVK